MFPTKIDLDSVSGNVFSPTEDGDGQQQADRQDVGEQQVAVAIEANRRFPSSIDSSGGLSSSSSSSNNGGMTSEDCEDLDSASEDSHFEGAEKLLEVWFTTSPKAGKGAEKNCDLRWIPRSELEVLLCTVKCSIISSTKNAVIDSYILSESSMFITKRRMIIKTCGKTTPLQVIQDLMKIVNMYSGFDMIEDIFYSRKNFDRPELQLQPHKSFQQEVTFLNDIFPEDGETYRMGTFNEDCWYLYTLNLTGHMDTEPDQTIEIMMTDLNQEVMNNFTKTIAKDGRHATKLSGIDTILPNMEIKDYLFDPCGYSMNGILKNEKRDCGLGEYTTIHITPEPEFSYVSFESNIPLTSYLEIIQRVLDTFKPGKFILTIFTNMTSEAAGSHKELQQNDNFGDMVCKDIEYTSFKNYELTYAQFVRLPS